MEKKGRRADYFRQLAQYKLALDSATDRYAKMDPKKALALFQTRLNEKCEHAVKNGKMYTFVDWSRGNDLAHKEILNEYLETEGFTYYWCFLNQKWACKVNWEKNEGKSEQYDDGIIFE